MKKQRFVPVSELRNFPPQRVRSDRLPRFGLMKIATLVLGLFSGAAVFGQHGHINAGARDGAQGSQLHFANGAEYMTNSGYVVALSRDTNAPFNGLYRGSVGFTSLSATPATGGPAPGHAGLGAFLELKVVEVEGPAGSLLALWKEDESTGETAKLFEVPAGTQNGTNRFPLTESDASPGSDPYGHIHGRSFTVSAPGLHVVGFQIVDTSANGADGGPIHQPSDIFRMYFQAGMTIAGIRHAKEEIVVTFAIVPGREVFLESASGLRSSGAWRTAAGPLTTERSGLQSVSEPAGEAGAAFYRLRASEP
jgi:hypothetical protein